eukprot:3622537-Prymnesium_polylepis.1
MQHVNCAARVHQLERAAGRNRILGTRQKCLGKLWRTMTCTMSAYGWCGLWADRMLVRGRVTLPCMLSPRVTERMAVVHSC